MTNEALWAAPAGGLMLDRAGRQIILRGVNLGGDSKVPFPDGGTQFPTDFANHREVSFIGRPFPLAEAEEHLGRLRHWGFNCLRLLTTWEAVEHGGAGVYDGAYLDYFAEVCERASRFGMHVFVDFHQDVWSRMTGGDGAPGWVFDALGMDFTKFHEADVVHLMQRKYDYTSPLGRQEAYPQMSWGTNYRLPANAILWSLFWCGRIFTPQFVVDGKNVQDFLQDRYLGAMGQIAARVAHLPNVIGFDTLNEPGTGFIGQPMSYRHVRPTEMDPSHPRHGVCLSPAESLGLAAGIPTNALVLSRNEQTGQMEPSGHRLLNACGTSIWVGECPFEQAGAYRRHGSEIEVLREDFFQASAGRKVDMSEDGYSPLFLAVADTIRSHNPDWAVFAELDPFGVSGGRKFPSKLPPNTVNATHWYDRATLFRKAFNSADHLDMATGTPETNPDQIRARYLRELSQRLSGPMGLKKPAPTLIGEFGIPYDLHDGEAYKAWASGQRDASVWDCHTEVLSLMYDVMDELQLHSTQWNYTASNSNDLRVGDCWNQEDLSIFSADQQIDPADPSSGGRAVAGFSRPFVQASQGRLKLARYNTQQRRFDFEVQLDRSISEPTIVYVPSTSYDDFDLQLSDPAGLEVERSADRLHVKILARRDGTLRGTLTPSLRS